MGGGAGGQIIVLIIEASVVAISIVGGEEGLRRISERHHVTISLRGSRTSVGKCRGGCDRCNGRGGGGGEEKGGEVVVVVGVVVGEDRDVMV